MNSTLSPQSVDALFSVHKKLRLNSPVDFIEKYVNLIIWIVGLAWVVLSTAVLSRYMDIGGYLGVALVLIVTALVMRSWIKLGHSLCSELKGAISVDPAMQWRALL
jgi:ATP/ADP translocase